MRILSLIVSLGGIFLLLLLLGLPAQEVYSLGSVEERSLVRFTGTVISVRSWGSGLLFSTDVGSFACACPITLIGKNVSVTGPVESFINKTFIRAYSIDIIN